VPLLLAPAEAGYLAGYLDRLRSWDERAAVRLQARGGVLGVYGPLPMAALALVVVPLAEPVTGTAQDGLDSTVSAGRLRDVLGDVRPEVTAAGPARDLRVPDPVTGPASLAVLPPRGGWVPAEAGLAGDVAPLVADAVAGFRSGIPATGSFHAELVATATWDGPGWGGVPMRALHAAQLLGFLAHGGAQIRSATAAGWVRLVTPAGQVFVRTGPAATGLSLVPNPS
jgi:hypothetical protein